MSDLSVTDANVYEGRGSSQALHRVVDQSGRSGLWKEYKEDVARAIDAELLTRLVQWPDTLTDRERERMLPHLAQPWAVVMQGDRVAGVVMPEAPQTFFYRDRRGRVRPRTIDTLSNSRRSSGQTSSPFFEPPHRLALLGRLLILVSELHDAGVVVGDLQPQNILVSADPLHPAVMVLDCDSFWLDGRHAFGSVTDPETWRSPWMGSSFTNQTDLFKLALLVTRCLQEDNRDWYPKREVLTQFMPTHQVERLEGLLAKEVTVSAQQLRGLAGNWRARVGSNGTMYNSTDQYLHAPWSPPPDVDPPWGTRPQHGQGAGQPYVSNPQVLTSNPPVSNQPSYGAAPPNYPAAPPIAPNQGPPPPEPIRAPMYPPGAPAGAPAPFGAPQPPGRRKGSLRQQIVAWVVFTIIAAGIVVAAINGNGQ